MHLLSHRRVVLGRWLVSVKLMLQQPEF